MNKLEPNKYYYLGDFIVKLTEAGVLRVTSDMGVINIKPQAENVVEINSVINFHDKKDEY